MLRECMALQVKIEKANKQKKQQKNNNTILTI